MFPSDASTKDGSNTGRNRLELGQIGNHMNNRTGGAVDHQAISSERNKHSRQKGHIQSSFDAGSIPKRVPSVHSINRDPNNSGRKDTDKTPNIATNETPPVKPNEGNGTNGERERFNAITKFAFATSCGH